MAIDKNSVMNEARKFAAKGQYDKAIAEWKKLLSETPNDANLYNTIGDLCIKKNSRAEAVDAYKRAADILAEDGFTSKAIALYKKVLNIDIKRVEVHLALGDMHAEKGLTGNALANYKYVADLYNKENNIAKALGIYQKMADLNPDNVAFRIKLADMYAKEGMKAEAAKAYLAAADVHLSKEELKEARQLFEKVLAIDPDNKAVYHKAGIVYLKEGKFGEACKALKPAFENDPANRELSDTYLEALTRAGKDSDAEHVIMKILAADPGRTDLHEKLYPIYIAKSEFEKALDTASALARARIESNDHGGAEEILKRFVADSPRFIPGRRALAELYVSLKRGGDAAETFLQAAKILAEEGNVERAKASLNSALRDRPRFSGSKRPARPDHVSSPCACAAGTGELNRGNRPAGLFGRAGAGSRRAHSNCFRNAGREITSGRSPGRTGCRSPGSRDEYDDPAIAEAMTEADVLVKYGLSTKAIEQLEGLALRFPESMQIRVKLRDLYGDQGQMRKATAHMLVMADLYHKRGMKDQAEEVLRYALEIDPSNNEISSRLGIAGPTVVPPEPAPTPFEDFSSPEDVTEQIAAAAVETAPTLEEPRPVIEPAPTDAIVIEGLDAGLPHREEEFPFPAACPPADEMPATSTHEPDTLSDSGIDATGGKPEPRVPHDDIPPSFGLDATLLDETSTDLDFSSVEEGTNSSPEETPADRTSDMRPAMAESAPDVEETAQQVEERRDSPPIAEERVEPEAPAPELAAPSDVGEIWAEAEFYFQQGLFDEAKKHYARIIGLNPGESEGDRPACGDFPGRRGHQGIFEACRSR